jgi:hypothetical protein
MNEMKVRTTPEVDYAGKAEQEQPGKILKAAPKDFCVIITNKKNSSWVDDLEAHDRLSSSYRVFH